MICIRLVHKKSNIQITLRVKSHIRESTKEHEFKKKISVISVENTVSVQK